MKKTIIAIVVAIATLITCILPAAAWSWADDGEYEVASYSVPIVEEGAIEIDVELDAEYLQGTKISNFDDEEPYKRGGYGGVWDDADGTFFAYIAVDVNGMYIYAEINDHTIFETTNSDANDGDMFQIYFDWCTPDIAHPLPEARYLDYVENGNVWDPQSNYKSLYTVGGLQYLGWISCDYYGVVTASGGFNPYTALGPEATDSALCEAKLIDGGWACEWFIPWRDDEQKTMIANGEQFHCGIGFQSCDDSDLEDLCTPGKEQSVGIMFDQRKELGLSYYADYSMLADVMWADSYPEGYWEGTYTPGGTDEEPPESSDTIFAVVAALVVAGAGVVVFARKKKD